MHRARRDIILDTRHRPHTIQTSRRAVSLRHPPHKLIQRSIRRAIIRRGNHASAAGQDLTHISIHNIIWNLPCNNPILNRKNTLVQTLNLGHKRLIRRSRARRVRNRLHTNHTTTHPHATHPTTRLNRNTRILVSLLQQHANRCARIQALTLQRAATIRERHLGRASKTLIISRQQPRAHQTTLDGLHLVNSQKTRHKPIHVNTRSVWSHINSLKTEILTPTHSLQTQRRNLPQRTVTHHRAHRISNRSHRHERRATNSARRRQTNAKKLRRTSRRQRPRINTRRKIRIPKHRPTHTLTPRRILNEIKRRKLTHRHALITHQRSSQHTRTRTRSSSQRLDHITHRSHISAHNIRANSRAIHTLTKRQHGTTPGPATKQHRHIRPKRRLLARKPIPQQRDNLISHTPTLTRHRTVITTRRRTHHTIRAPRLSIRQSHARHSHRRANTHTRNTQPSRQKHKTSTHNAPTQHTVQGTLLYYRKHTTTQISRQHRSPQHNPTLKPLTQQTRTRKRHANPPRSHGHAQLPPAHAHTPATQPYPALADKQRLPHPPPATPPRTRYSTTPPRSRSNGNRLSQREPYVTSTKPASSAPTSTRPTHANTSRAL